VKVGAIRHLAEADIDELGDVFEWGTERKK